jgi:hypothetical protein
MNPNPALNHHHHHHDGRGQSPNGPPPPPPPPLIRSTWRTAHERAVDSVTRTVSYLTAAEGGSTAQRSLDPARARACSCLAESCGSVAAPVGYSPTTALPVPARKHSSSPRSPSSLLARCLLALALYKQKQSTAGQSSEFRHRADQAEERNSRPILHFKHKKRREHRRGQEGALCFLKAALRDDGVRWWCEDGGCCGGGGEDGCAMGSWLQLAALLGDLSG